MGQDKHEFLRFHDLDDPNPMAKRALPSVYAKRLDHKRQRVLNWRLRKAAEAKYMRGDS